MKKGLDQMPKAKAGYNLTDHEGALLAEVLRRQPVTAYRITKAYGIDPVSSFNSSKGQVYPMIKRLAQRRLLKSIAISGDARGTETWECTKKGEAALREWLKTVRPGHLLLEDPMRTKIMSFDLLDHDEKLEWVFNAKAELHTKLGELEAYGKSVDVPFQAFVHDNAVSSIKSRMDWLDRMLFVLMKDKSESDGTSLI